MVWLNYIFFDILRLRILLLAALLVFAPDVLGQEVQTETADQPPSAELSEISQAYGNEELVNSLQLLGLSLEQRLIHLGELQRELNGLDDEVEGEARRAVLQDEISALRLENEQAREEIELVILGLQSREYSDVKGENSAESDFNLTRQIGQIFQPIIASMERATEPSRRLEELRQLAARAERRAEIANDTLDHIAQFRKGDAQYSSPVESRLQTLELEWSTRLQETTLLSNALNEQLEAAINARGSTWTHFARDFGRFVLDRGMSLILALGLGVGFFLLCQTIVGYMARNSRAKTNGVLSATNRIIGMIILAVGFIGAFVIALTIFNIRNDWLMLAVSLLLGIALAWSFVQALPGFLEESRMLLNLGPVREGERTIVDGLPYRVERLSFYSRLSNPDLKGGEIMLPVRELLNRYSRDVTEGEKWFPTQIGDWIARGEELYQVISQSPEHVLIQALGGAEDFVPIQKFLQSEFFIVSNGYCRQTQVGLSYDHMDLASSLIPESLEKYVYERVSQRIGEDAIEAVNVRLVELASSSLDFEIRVMVKAGNGQYWAVIKSDIHMAVLECVQQNGWTIPFPQRVIHNV